MLSPLFLFNLDNLGTKVPCFGRLHVSAMNGGDTKVLEISWALARNIKNT